MMNKKYGIIAVGYNRKEGLKRLMQSLEDAFYDKDEVTLIISIDKSGEEDCVKCANEFMWSHGEKRVVAHEKRLGLRAHILSCGNYLEEFDAIAIFEDDIVAANGYYLFMKEAVNKYYDNDKVAGIALYSPQWNNNIDMPFTPQPSSYDIFFMQVPQSWGQIWMKKQWREFIEWYKKNEDSWDEDDQIPDFVHKWPETSWLKYHFKYCVIENKFFVYPYNSYSTCYADVGEHVMYTTTCFQVPMQYSIKKDFRFPKNDEDAVFYDVFRERELKYQIDSIHGIPIEEISWDLYASRRDSSYKKYLISTKQLPFQVIRSYALVLKPHEMNILYDIEGKDIFLYNTTVKRPILKKTNGREIRHFRYYFQIYGKTRIMLKSIIENIKIKVGIGEF